MMPGVKLMQQLSMQRLGVVSVVSTGLLVLIMCASYPAWADRPRDYLEAQRLRQQGTILPLSDILQRAEAVGVDTLLEVELDKEDGRWIYELEGISAEQRMIEVELDAKSGAILEVETKKRHHHGKDSKDRDSKDKDGKDNDDDD